MENNNTTSQRYTKKPVTVTALLWTGSNNLDILDFVECRGYIRHHSTTGEPQLWIETLEGEMKASPGDYIIKGVKGEFYPCKPNIFAATYTHEDGSEVSK